MLTIRRVRKPSCFTVALFLRTKFYETEISQIKNVEYIILIYIDQINTHSISYMQLMHIEKDVSQ